MSRAELQKVVCPITGFECSLLECTIPAGSSCTETAASLNENLDIAYFISINNDIVSTEEAGEFMIEADNKITLRANQFGIPEAKYRKYINSLNK